MTIKNETLGKILATSAIKADSFKQKTFGLILHKKPTTMIFQTRFGIHTLFMRYPIDVVVLDKENKVVVKKQNLKPNRIFLWDVNYDTVIEFPNETLNTTNIGHKISLKY